MKPLYIFRHIECEGPGYLQQVLDDYNIPTQLIRIDAGENPPANIDDCSGLVFMGGAMSVNDPLDWIEAECHLIRLAMDQRLPVLGHCLGGQLIAKALGASISKNPIKEIGWHEVKLTETEFARAWCPNLAPSFNAFHWHGETFSIPAGATPLLQSELCRNQAFFLGNCLALQCHVEMTVDMIKLWTQEYAEEIGQPNEGIQSAEQIMEGIEAKVSGLQTTAKILYQRWLQPLLNP